MFFEPFGWVALSTDTTTVCENSPSRVAGSLSSHSSWQAGAGGLWKIPTARFGILFPPTSRLTRGKWVEDYGCSQDPAKKNMKTRARDKNREASSFLRKKKPIKIKLREPKKKTMNRNHESCLLFFGGNYSTRIIVGSQKKLPIFSSKVIPRPLGSGSPNKNARNSTMMREECLYMWKKQYVCICIYIYMRNIIYIYLYQSIIYIQYLY